MIFNQITKVRNGSPVSNFINTLDYVTVETLSSILILGNDLLENPIGISRTDFNWITNCFTLIETSIGVS